MSMTREEFERLGAPAKIAVYRVAAMREGCIMNVASVGEGVQAGKQPPPTHAGLIVAVKDEELKVLIALEKDECDEIIRALIACRNHLWPGA